MYSCSLRSLLDVVTGPLICWFSDTQLALEVEGFDTREEGVNAECSLLFVSKGVTELTGGDGLHEP